MSKIEVNAIEPQCGTNLTVGASGDTITFPSGTTVVNNGSQTGFGRTGTVDWDTTPKTASFSAVSGNGYFVNTTSGAITVTLPAGSAGAIVSLADYAATWQTNNLTVSPNGTDKIGSQNENATLNVQGQSVTFVYVDSTQGWINTMDSTSNVRGTPPFIAATGGTITTCGNFKIHTFTGPGTFTVTAAGTPAGSNTIDYLVLGGGGSGGPDEQSGGGGAGGFRESSGAASGCYTASPLGACVAALPVTAQGYPVTVGGGGAPQGTPNCTPGNPGSNSVFSTITSAGGGAGGRGSSNTGGPHNASAGGSGGGGGSNCGTGGSGNTPPVSPPQGQNGGTGGPSADSGPYGGGGGGAGAAGTSGNNQIAPGGNGVTSSINATATTRAGGGGGGGHTPGTRAPGGTGGGGTGGGFDGSPPFKGGCGTVNTGGGGGGAASNAPCTGAGGGGSGIVIIRYKFQ